MGEIAGNIMAAIPAVQFAVNIEIVIGFRLVIPFIVVIIIIIPPDCSADNDSSQDIAEVEIKEKSIIF
jgi:hypothetical protein